MRRWLTALALSLLALACKKDFEEINIDGLTILDAVIESSTDGKTFTPESKTIEGDAESFLRARIEARTKDKDKITFASNGGLDDDLNTEPFPKNWNIQWNYVESEKDNYTNGKFKARIDYRNIPVSNDDLLRENARPGTRRYSFSVKTSDGNIHSRGAADMNTTHGSVHRISQKGNTGNKIVDNALTFVGVPYVWGSRENQVEEKLGVDCADLVTIANRLSGIDVPFTYSKGLPKYATRKSVIDRIDSGLYMSNGQPISISDFPEGSTLIFPWRHAAIFSSDANGNGLLDQNDLMVHTLMSTSKEEKIGEYDPPSHILRFD